MPQERFSIKSLERLDGGKVAVAIDGLISAALRDCEDRPAVSKPRTVTVEIVLKPAADEQGNVETVPVQFRLKSKGPSMESRVYVMAPRRLKNESVLTFNPDTLGDPNTPSLPLDNDD